MLKDNCTLHFNCLNDFIAHLDEVERNTYWEEKPNHELFFATSNPDQLFDDPVSDSTGLKLTDGRLFCIHPIELRECSLVSLCQRLGLGGELIKYIDNAGFIKLANIALDYIPEAKLKLPIVDGKVNAFLSDKYDSTMPANKVFRCLNDEIDNLAEGETVGFEGWWSYSLSSCEFQMPQNLNKNLDGNIYNTTITMRTSDAGFSSVVLGAFLSDGTHSCIPLMTEWNMIHKGKSGMVKLEESMTMLRDVISDGITKLNRLLTVQLDHPQATMKRIAKRVGLPKKDALEVIEQFGENNPFREDPCSALECYVCLAGILNNGYDLRTRLRVQSDLAKTISFNWSSYDISRDFAW